MANVGGAGARLGAWAARRVVFWVVGVPMACAGVLGIAWLLALPAWAGADEAHRALTASADLAPVGYGVAGLPVGVVSALVIWRSLVHFFPWMAGKPGADLKLPPKSPDSSLISELEAAVLPKRGKPLDDRVAECEDAIRLQASEIVTLQESSARIEAQGARLLELFVARFGDDR